VVIVAELTILIKTIKYQAKQTAVTAIMRHIDLVRDNILL